MSYTPRAVQPSLLARRFRDGSIGQRALFVLVIAVYLVGLAFSIDDKSRG